MQLKQRIKKLERQTGATDKFCQCGTPYIATFVIGGENIVCNVCPDCGRDVRRRTGAEFVIDANRHEYEIEIIKPKAEFTRAEFEDWQNRHVINGKTTYEQYLADIAE